jgi:hypothetical protein
MNFLGLLTITKQISTLNRLLEHSNFLFFHLFTLFAQTNDYLSLIIHTVKICVLIRHTAWYYLCDAVHVDFTRMRMTENKNIRADLTRMRVRKKNNNKKAKHEK